MKVLTNNEEYNIKIVDTYINKIFNFYNKKEPNSVYLYQDTNKVSTFFLKTQIDIVGINKKNIVIFKYINAPKNKVIEVINEKENTDILIFPKNSTRDLKIGETLTFINEDII